MCFLPSVILICCHPGDGKLSGSGFCLSWGVSANSDHCGPLAPVSSCRPAAYFGMKQRAGIRTQISRLALSSVRNQRILPFLVDRIDSVHFSVLLLFVLWLKPSLQQKKIPKNQGMKTQRDLLKSQGNGTPGKHIKPLELNDSKMWEKLQLAGSV